MKCNLEKNGSVIKRFNSTRILHVTLQPSLWVVVGSSHWLDEYTEWSLTQFWFLFCCVSCLVAVSYPYLGLDIKHLVYMPIGHVVIKISVRCKNFHGPSQYLYRSCKAYIYCWKNKYMPRLKNHSPCWARNHKCLCALWQDLYAPGMWLPLNVEPWYLSRSCHCHWGNHQYQWSNPEEYG